MIFPVTALVAALDGREEKAKKRRASTAYTPTLRIGSSHWFTEPGGMPHPRAACFRFAFYLVPLVQSIQMPIRERHFRGRSLTMSVTQLHTFPPGLSPVPSVAMPRGYAVKRIDTTLGFSPAGPGEGDYKTARENYGLWATTPYPSRGLVISSPSSIGQSDRVRSPA